MRKWALGGKQVAHALPDRTRQMSLGSTFVTLTASCPTSGGWINIQEHPRTRIVLLGKCALVALSCQILHSFMKQLVGRKECVSSKPSLRACAERNVRSGYPSTEESAMRPGQSPTGSRRENSRSFHATRFKRLKTREEAQGPSMPWRLRLRGCRPLEKLSRTLPNFTSQGVRASLQEPPESAAVQRCQGRAQGRTLARGALGWAGLGRTVGGARAGDGREAAEEPGGGQRGRRAAPGRSGPHFLLSSAFREELWALLVLAGPAVRWSQLEADPGRLGARGPESG